MRHLALAVFLLWVCIMALTSLAQVKAFLNIPVANITMDPWLTALMLAAELHIKNYLNRDLEQQTYTEYYSGTGTNILALRSFPVSSVVNVWLDFNGNFGQVAGAFASSTLLVVGRDYVLSTEQSGTLSRNGLLVRLNGIWSEVGRQYYPGKVTGEVGPALGCIKVEYTAGYSPIPLDIQYAVAFLTSAMRRAIPIGGNLESETLGDYKYVLTKAVSSGATATPEWASANAILDNYREVPV